MTVIKSKPIKARNLNTVHLSLIVIDSPIDGLCD